MYRDNITLFCRYTDSQGELWWRPVHLEGVDLNEDRASIISSYGEASQDRALLHIRVKMDGKTAVSCGNAFVLPKEYIGENGTFSLKSGENFDFFIAGDITVSEPETDIEDSDYLDGFFDAMNAEYDRCYKVSNASLFSVIPHLEVTGR